ncbi:MAG: hypothetical protein KDE31_10730, partial [Caldilineaceae bacterium]|nr:hypothetical protein [Caldilineaceae bacterium]
TNGQVAFGQINIYQNKENWWQSDIQVYASNTQRPNANLGGIVTNYITDTLKTGEVVNNAFLPGKIRIGATWNRYGNPGGTVGEDWPRVLAHEFGHYGLFLLDNYLGVQEVNGSKIIVETDCAGSAMTDAYRQDYSEFLSRLTTNSAGFGWLGNCLTTLAEDTTGRSDWETIQKFYPFLNENIATTAVGPTRLPLAVTQVAFNQPDNAQTLLTTPVFYINDTLGNLVPFTRGEAQVYLFKEGATADTADDEILFLGTPSGPLIQARGAAVGDRLCVYDNASQPPRVGCLDNLIDSGASLMLHEVGDWQPQIEVRPVNSTTLEITVQQAAAGAINVQIFPSFRPTSTVEALTGTLSDMGNGVHSGQFQFPLTVFDGHLRVWEDGASPTRETVTRFANAP